MRAHENVSFNNISATPAAFVLNGGLYQFEAIATWGGGSVTLNQLGPDGSTYLSVSNPQTANGGQTLYLPPGQYQVAITTATAVYIDITRVPSD